MQVDPTIFAALVSKGSFISNGDDFERNYGRVVAKDFPSCERFWQQFVIPFTTRVEGYPNNLNTFPDAARAIRENINPDIRELANAHYTVFHHLVYAAANLTQVDKVQPALSDFYTHLASACDLAETVLERWYLLRQQCMHNLVEAFQPQKRQEFLQWVGIWYDENYQEIYENYLAKGKTFRFEIPKRKSLLNFSFR